ncbi:HU domain-containing protein [Bacteroides caecigallinarum]|uniref:HU domain-containing protein n=1 Tax=Bacteroides caecigallinarum TaxID=1411144 RepID=UPI00195EF0B9|nr:SPOR domain-containing protein [Bacteroides caecigallinarum]MBM6883574.1 SPOR domain-containing protein [Bacteroides caecigallinarum]MBM6891002.1 SPOR domain-containing protein [Bacteroides caecigallinarum]MCF2551461.1 SPOR domain-containing protein [Bacteroides caecigallinarum]
MKELAKHIEILLMENDCVIVPGLGGFIAHNKPAEFRESANIFCPPLRTIGFNPQLTINDGLLVQAYMQAYDTDFPDASRKIENTVSSIKDILYKNGQAELDNIGTLYYTMAGNYGFEPCYNSFFSPNLYGLGNFSISPLSELVSKIQPVAEPRVTIETTPSVKTNEERREKQSHIIKRMTEHAIGIAAAIILFFIMSVPVENTYLDNASYASLGAETMLDAIRNKSLAITPNGKDINKEFSKDETHQANISQRKNNVNTLRPVSVKSVKVEKPLQKADIKAETKENKNVIAENKPVTESKPAESVKQQQEKGLFIIVSSLQTMADAEKELTKFHNQGYDEARILTSDNRFRIALYQFTDKSQAYSKINELRKEEQFKNAWLLNKSK